MILWGLLGYGLIISVVALVIMAQDKASARTSEKARRTPESQLLFLAILGGSLGVYAGMFLFRHKTNKAVFMIGLPLLLVQQIALIYFLVLPLLMV